MAREVLPVVHDTPVLAGVCGTDPFRLMPVFLEEVERVGFSGVQNFPTVGLCDGRFRQNLEETGMSYELEVEMIAEARRLRQPDPCLGQIDREGPSRPRRIPVELVVIVEKADLPAGAIFDGEDMAPGRQLGPDPDSSEPSAPACTPPARTSPSSGRRRSATQLSPTARLVPSAISSASACLRWVTSRVILA